MKLKLSAKSIFIILIVLIITILTFNYINRNSQLNSEKIQDIDPSKEGKTVGVNIEQNKACLLYTSPSPRDREKSRMPSSA